MDWIADNYLLLAALVVALLGVARVVVKLTATPKDDEIVERVADVVEKIVPVTKK